MRAGSTFFRRRSLTVALLTLPIGPISIGMIIGLRHSPMTASIFFASVAAGAAFTFVCVLAFINLIKDVERGYSPQRCSLAAVVLLLATFPVLMLLVVLANRTVKLLSGEA